jgi:glyoxylase-like metal-dependent hydrolase (beta-lactamase superfamily II)
MRGLSVVIATVVLVLSSLIAGPAPVLAQPATPVVGSEGGALYTFDSGEAGFFTKTYFYDTGSEVVAFDAQFTPELAEAAIASLREQTDNPITYLVITHPNPDKFNGAPAFQDQGTKVIASEATEAAIPGVHEYKKAGFVGMGMFTEETYPQQATVDENFTGTHVLELGDGKSVELSELSEPGVSSTQTVAFIPELNALIVGDLVHHKLHAWLEGGIVEGQATPTLEGWIADLEELEERFAGDPEPSVYGGRGEAAPLSVAVADQIAYLQTADQIVTDYVTSLGDRQAELSSDKAGEHYAAIQAELAEAFPDYAFPDMISFSVYGLVNSKR